MRRIEGTRAVVLGGAGFLGSHLCDRLLAAGAERVTAVDSLITGSERNIDHLGGEPRFRFLCHDVTRPLPFAERVDFVFNLASPASPVDYAKLPLETLRVGSLGTENALVLAREKGATFLQASTSEVYGDPLVHPQGEAYWGNVNPIGPRAVYDEAKRYGEAITSAYRRLFRVDSRIARIFNTYGPRMRLDDGRVVPTFIGEALRGEDLTVLGDGTQTRSFCYVADLIEGLVRLAVSEVTGPVNLGNPAELTILDFAQAVQKAAGTHLRIRFEPLPKDDPKQRRPDITRARTLLRWTPQVDLEAGLEETIGWFKGALARKDPEARAVIAP